MRSSRRGMRYAAVGFVLMMLVVLGGMSWATVNTVRLARIDFEKHQRYNLVAAMNRMEGHMMVTFINEGNRPFTDYGALIIPDAIIADHTGTELNPMAFRLPTELFREGPPPNWNGFYFHVDAEGNWRTPYLLDPYWHPGESLERFVENTGREEVVTERLAQLEAWLPVEDIEQRWVEARQRISPQEDGTGSHGEVSMEPEVTDDFYSRSMLVTTVAQAHLPTDSCVADVLRNGSYPGTLVVEEVETTELMPIWLNDTESERLLALVRIAKIGSEEDKVYYQGFVLEWSALQKDLLDLIGSFFPDDAQLKLVPTAPDETGEQVLSSIPARLEVIATWESPQTAAWHAVGGWLVATWVAATVVLVAAGLGTRNLMALTERRMQFAYAVTHELRTPLTTFRLYSDMLAGGLVPEESKQEYLQTLERESRRLSSLVEGVLEYARLENQKVRLNLGDTSASALLGSIEEMAKGRCNDVGVETTVGLDTDNSKLKLRTDVGLVTQIVGVLVHNACRYAKSASEPKVVIHLGIVGRRVHVDVIDSGPGVDRSETRRIFRPFRRGKMAAKAAQGGIGLGLALARSWVSLLGGRLDLVARRHQQHGGAHFRLTIPAVAKE